MNSLIAAAGLLLVASASAASPALPIRSGTYTFQHRFAEQPEMLGAPLRAKIAGRRIVLINDGPDGVFPHGVIAEGTLTWHVKTKQWIISTERADRSAQDVGGCSDGPEVVDLFHRIYWTC
jgi:hypothetical protein